MGLNYYMEKKICEYTGEEMIETYDGYGHVLIPIGFQDIYSKIFWFRKTHQANASFYPENPYADTLAKIKEEINELINLSPQYKELAKAYFWDGQSC